MLSVSVIIVTFLRDVSVLNEALNSVLNQNVLPIQIIIVDTSGSKERHEQMQNHFSSDYIQLVFTELPSNASEGRNLGARFAKGDYICFLDDDDLWKPDKLYSQIKEISSETVLVFSPYVVSSVFGTKKFDKKEFDFNGHGYPDILGSNFVGCTSFPLISLKAFNLVGGFDEKFEANQEWDLWIRLSKIGNFSYSPAIAGVKNENSDSITLNPVKRKSGWYSLFKKHIFEYMIRPKCGAVATGYFYREMWKNRCYVSSYLGFLVHLVLRLRCLFLSDD